ncbi:MAG: CoA-binding protein [Sphaerobacteraceae bacterium]|nr:MAG: CoA-binding protein [Sphaerobacteraceae bacterium]
MPRIETDDELRQVISGARTIAVVGLSPREHRDSFRVAKYLQDQGYRIVPVNPNTREVLGETAYQRLEDVPYPIDIVDVFRRPDAVEEIARDAVAVGARAIWFQIGVVNESAAAMASDAGLDVVMDRCLMVDHGRLSSQG